MSLDIARIMNDPGYCTYLDYATTLTPIQVHQKKDWVGTTVLKPLSQGGHETASTVGPGPAPGTSNWLGIQWADSVRNDRPDQRLLKQFPLASSESRCFLPPTGEAVITVGLDDRLVIYQHTLTQAEDVAYANGLAIAALALRALTSDELKRIADAGSKDSIAPQKLFCQVYAHIRNRATRMLNRLARYGAFKDCHEIAERLRQKLR